MFCPEKAILDGHAIMLAAILDLWLSESVPSSTTRSRERGSAVNKQEIAGLLRDTRRQGVWPGFRSLPRISRPTWRRLRDLSRRRAAQWQPGTAQAAGQCSPSAYPLPFALGPLQYPIVSS